VIRDGQDGLLVPFGDVPALATVIERLLRDRDVARTLGVAGRERVLRELTWDAAYGRMRSLYGHLLQEVVDGAP
jgi:glycosyltransferase involved in cell wall biosynthesis